MMTTEERIEAMRASQGPSWIFEQGKMNQTKGILLTVGWLNGTKERSLRNTTSIETGLDKITVPVAVDGPSKTHTEWRDALQRTKDEILSR